MNGGWTGQRKRDRVPQFHRTERRTTLTQTRGGSRLRGQVCVCVLDRDTIVLIVVAAADAASDDAGTRKNPQRKNFQPKHNFAPPKACSGWPMGGNGDVQGSVRNTFQTWTKQPIESDMWRCTFGRITTANKQTNKQASNNDDDDDDCRMTNAHGYSVLQGTVECRKVKSAFKDSVALRRRYGGTIITRLGDELEDPFKRPSQATYSVGWSKTRRRILSDCGSIQCLGSSFAVVVVVVIFSLSHTHIRGNSGQQSVECDLSLLDFFSSFFRLRRWP